MACFDRSCLPGNVFTSLRSKTSDVVVIGVIRCICSTRKPSNVSPGPIAAGTLCDKISTVKKKRATAVRLAWYLCASLKIYSVGIKRRVREYADALINIHGVCMSIFSYCFQYNTRIVGAITPILEKKERPTPQEFSIVTSAAAVGV